MAPNGSEGLNDNQRRHFLSSCQYVDRLLTEMEAILAAGDSGSPFNRYVGDAPPAQQKVVRDYIARMRRELVRALASEGVEPSRPDVSATFALRTHLGFVDIAIEELKPSYMRGFGDVPPAAAERLGGIIGELLATVRKLDQQLARGTGDLQERFARLQAAGRDVSTIRVLGEIIDRQALTEFRPALELLLDRLEDRHFEVAVFGRVSTGKSSLLNHLLQIDALPVGVNPITAIPTRLVHGAPPRVAVEYLSGTRESVAIERLAEFASEEQNPGNTRRVSRLTVHLPSPRLQDGVVFVDTPGLGSLASSGAAETLAYLPRCDLGFVLVDAASTLTPEDIATVRTLMEAGISVMVLLSKADLVAADALARVQDYVTRNLDQQLGTHLAVFPVSVVPSHGERLKRWYSEAVLPRLDAHEELRAASVSRKIGALAEAGASTLERQLSRTAAPARRGEALAELSAATSQFDRARADGDEILLAIPPAWKVVLRHAAERLAQRRPSEIDSAAADSAVHATLDEAMTLMTAPLLERLKALIEDVRTRLEAAGATTEGLDVASVLRELPRPDLGTLPLNVRVGAVRVLGAGAVRGAIERALDEQAGSEIQAAVSAFAALLRQWYLRTLDRVRTSFELAADSHRAQWHAAERGPADAATAAQVAADLDRLRTVLSGRPAAASRDQGAA